MLRGLRWRAGLSAAVWACVVVVCAGAALGPVFALAAAESGLQDVLRDAGAATNIRLQGQSAGSPQVTMTEARARLQAVASVPAVALRRRRVPSLFMSASGSAGASGMHSRMVWRPGSCGLVRLDAGRCPTRAGEAMVSARSVALHYGWRLGAELTLASDAGPVSAPVRIVGVYTPRSTTAAAWSGQGYFQTGVDRQDDRPITDAVFVSEATFSRLPGSAEVQVGVDLPLDVGAVRLSDMGVLRQQVAALQRVARPRQLVVSTGVGPVLDRAARVQARIDAATALVVVQLCVLGWLVLHRVLVDLVEARRADVALAKLRGFRFWPLVGFGLGEPVLLLVTAIPVGAAMAYLGCLVLVRSVLLPGTPVVFTWQAVLALSAAVAGGVGAIVQTAWGVLRQPVLEQWRRTRVGPRGSRSGLLVDVLVASAAAVAFIALRVIGAKAGPVALLGPGLLVAAAGFAGARILPFVLRPLVPATVASRRIGLFLAVRQVVRRPAGLRLVALLTVAVGLAVFGVGGEVVAANNRVARAAAEVGTTRVERLQFTPGEDVVAQVTRADPTGRWAAAAATWITFGGTDAQGYVLAVDARRLASIGVPAAGLPSPSSLARLLTVGSVDPLVIRGRSLAARIQVSDLEGGPAPAVAFEVRRSNGPVVEVAAGMVRAGGSEYRATVPCTAGCEVVGVELIGDVRAVHAVTGTASVEQIQVDGHPVEADLTAVNGWRAARPLGDASDRVTVTRSGLEDRFRIASNGTGGIVHGDLEDPVPAVVGGSGASTTRTGASLSVTASDGSTARLVVAGAAPVLPAVLNDGLVVDLRSFQAALPGFAIDASWAVWIGPDAPPDAIARLRAAGLTTDGGSTLADRQAELARQGPALALLLLAVCAVAGALLATGGTAVSIGATLRRRSYEAAALSTVGIRRSQIYRAALTEQALLLGTALVVGIPAGLLALLLALPAIPEFADSTPVPLASIPPAAPIVICALVLTAVVGAAVLLSAARVVRAGSPTRLREGEE